MSNTISLLSQEDVRGIIKEELSKFNPVIIPSQDQFIDKKECAALLGGVCLSTVDGLRRKGIFKRYNIGSMVRFKRSQVIEAIELMNKKKAEL